MADSLTVAVISPEKTVFQGTADMIVAPAWDGEVGVMRGHAPMLVLLGAGDVRVKTGGSEQKFHIGGGFMQVVDDVVTILSEQAAEA
ncbi:MAG: ATP synthase F1 subunit epsilon [Longimicrobiales bacterium]